MKKIISLYKRDYEDTRQVYNEVVEGAEWVINGEGIATEKYDGTSCLIKDGVLYKRYDRKLTKEANKRKQKNDSFIPAIVDFKEAPDGWIAAEDNPNIHTGHWPGWLEVVFSLPENKWHKVAWGDYGHQLTDGTYELIGSHIQGNPYNLKSDILLRHGAVRFNDVPTEFEALKQWLSAHEIEGIVWHHPDGRMVKIKRRDFGLEWPIKNKGE